MISMAVLLIYKKTKQMFEKTLPFSNGVWYYKSKENVCSEYMFGFGRTEKIW